LTVLNFSILEDRRLFEVIMFKRALFLGGLAFCSYIASAFVFICFSGISARHSSGSIEPERVVCATGHQSVARFAQYNEPPASPCTVVSYAACNYLVPSNDYVSFSLANDISFTTCPAAQVHTATITFQAAPTAPLFVWLSNASGSTTPVYMTGATQTITKAWFGAGATSWFGGGPWTTLNVRAIYPNPPPSTYYYPISCTIVYQ
jgi:hypothetical protein